MCQSHSFNSVTCCCRFGHPVTAAFSRSRFCGARTSCSVFGNTGSGARLLVSPLQHIWAGRFCTSLDMTSSRTSSPSCFPSCFPAPSYLLSLRRCSLLVCVPLSTLPEPKLTAGSGPVRAFPRRAQGIPPSIRALFPVVLHCDFLAFLRGRSTSRCSAAGSAQGPVPFLQI